MMSQFCPQTLPQYSRYRTCQSDFILSSGRTSSHLLARRNEEQLIILPITLECKMPPSSNWTGHSGGYWQQVELHAEMVQAEWWWWWRSWLLWVHCIFYTKLHSYIMHQALLCHVDLTLGHLPDQSWKRRPGRPNSRWIDQLRRDQNNTPPADLWRRSTTRGHSRVTLRSSTTMRWRRRRRLLMIPFLLSYAQNILLSFLNH